MFYKHCNIFLNLSKNGNIEEHSICNFSTNFLRGSEIAQEAGKILPKLKGKFCEFKISPKPQH